jgi:hypothetical protein
MSKAKDLSEKIKESLAYPETFGTGQRGTAYPLSFAASTLDSDGTRIDNADADNGLEDEYDFEDALPESPETLDKLQGNYT